MRRSRRSRRCGIVCTHDDGAGSTRTGIRASSAASATRCSTSGGADGIA